MIEKEVLGLLNNLHERVNILERKVNEKDT